MTQLMKRVSPLESKLIDAYSTDCNYEVFLNGENVSQYTARARCPLAPSVEGFGWVDVYQLDAEGNFQVFGERRGGSRPLTLRRYGQVRWEHAS